MKKYQKAEIEMLAFECADVITSSVGFSSGSGADYGDDWLDGAVQQ